MITKKNVLIFNANPKRESFSSEICKKYLTGAKETGAKVKLVNLIDIDFDLILRNGYSKTQTVEKGITDVQIKIKEADHLVFVFPTWWGTYPALLKGFIDRTFTPDFAFKYRNNSLLWDKLLNGKSARIITTMDTPKWYYKLIYKSPGHNSLKLSVLKFCGIKPVKITTFSPIKKSTERQREKWLEKVKELGRKTE